MTEIRNTSILSNLERKFIIWMLPKFPSYITPDILTFTALISGILTCYFYYLSYYNEYWLFMCSFLIIVHWFTDSHDGRLAVYRKTPKPRYGHYIDCICDNIVAFLIFLGLQCYGFDQYICYTLYGLYNVLCYHSLIKLQSTGNLQLSFLGISPTESRIFLIILNTLLFFHLKNFVRKACIFGIWFMSFTIIGQITITSIDLNIKDSMKYI